MNYLEFKNHYGHLPVITINDIANDFDNLQTLRNQLSRWQKNGLVQKLKRGVFILNPSDRKTPIHPYYLGNRLYEPSYISLESALNHYGLIPERVTDITSITTRKTMKLDNDLGRFIYRHIKPSAFRGFKQVKLDSRPVYMAEPEKAVLDFFYFHLKLLSNNLTEVILDSFRFQNFEELSIPRMKDLCALFHCKKLTHTANAFCGLIEGAP